MFSREYCEIFKNTYFEEHLRTAASIVINKFSIYFTKRLFIWRWAAPVRRAGSPRWDDFYPTFKWNLLWGCSYGGELAWLGGLARLGRLARLGEISPSLRNSYKNIMCSYEKRASPPKWDLTWFCRDPTWVRWKFSIWTRASGPARQGGISFLKSILFCFSDVN